MPRGVPRPPRAPRLPPVVSPKLPEFPSQKRPWFDKIGKPTTPLPLEQRKQVFLPEFVITLVRTPFLAPRYASFWVPLNFNKLDMKDYLKRVYEVDVVKIRSFVQQQKVTRELPRGQSGVGRLRRPMARKKMTVEMTQPFFWPEPPKDFAPWDQARFYEIAKSQEESGKSATDVSKEAPKKKRKLLEEQAKELQQGKQKWRPTWQVLGLNYDRPLAPAAQRRDGSS